MEAAGIYAASRTSNGTKRGKYVTSQARPRYRVSLERPTGNGGPSDFRSDAPESTARRALAVRERRDVGDLQDLLGSPVLCATNHRAADL